MGEVSDAQSGGQNGEVTAPSDEGNPDIEGDDIANEDPVEEDPVTEEPSEEEVKNPVEEEVMDPSTDNVMTLMGAEVFDFTEENVTIQDTDNVTVNDAENSKGLTTESGSEAYFFQAKATSGQIAKVVAVAERAEGESVTLATDATDNAQKITSEASGDYTKYTIPLTDAALGEGFSYSDLTSLTISITVSYTVTVTKSTSGITKVTYLFTDDNTDPTEESTELTTASITSTDSTKNLKLYVKPATGYNVTVKKDGVVVSGNNNVYNLSTITKDTEVSIDAAKTGYEVKSNVAAADGEAIDEDALAAVEVKWGRMVDENGTITKYDYEQAVAVIEQNAEQISKSIADYMQKYEYPWLNEDDLENEIKVEVTYQLENRIRGYLGDDSGVDLSDIWSQMTVDEGTFKAPTTTAAGLVKVTVTLTNGKTDTEKKTKDVVFTVNLPAFEATVSDVKDAVEEFLGNATAYNNTTKAALLKDLKAYMAENCPDYVTTSIRYEITEFEKTEATTSAPGRLKVKINVYNIATGDEEETDEITIAINQLLGEGDLITAVKKAVGVEAPDNSTTDAVIAELTATNNRAKVKKAVLDAANEAIVGNPYKVEFEKKAESDTNDDADTDEFDFVPATGEKTGSLSFKLRIKNADGTDLSAEEATKGVITLTDAEVAVITGMLLPTEAKAKVDAWITANTLTAADYESATTKVLKNGATAEGILNAIRSDANGVPTTSKIEMSFKEGKCTIQDATVNDEGKIEGIIVLTDTMENEDPEEVELNVVIPALPQKEDEAVTKIQAAVAAAVAAGDIALTADTEDGDETVTNAILAAAKGAEGLKKDAFGITVKTDGELKIIAATETESAKATITLVVKLTGSDGTGTDCAIEIPIPVETPAE